MHRDPWSVLLLACLAACIAPTTTTKTDTGTPRADTAETDGDTDTDADLDTDTDVDTDTDTDVDTDTDSDADTDPSVHSGHSGDDAQCGGCPPGEHCAMCLDYSSHSGYGYYYTCMSNGWTCGRPLRLEDGRIARARSDALVGSGPAAELWTRLALDEHASVAAFARQVLDLMALGAPSDLVRRTSEAALDEVAHAEEAFALASRFAGRPVGPGPLPGNGRAAAGLVDLAVATFVDGCLNETLSTAIAIARRAGAVDEGVVAALDRVIGDETRHAALAFATVAWALRVGGPEVKAAVTAAWAAYTLPAAEGEAAPPSVGGLSAAETERAVRHGHQRVLGPAVAALLA